MIPVAKDFLDESHALSSLLEAREMDWDRELLFKGWSANQILRHLHLWNEAALLSLTDTEGFTGMLQEAMPKMMAGGLRAYEDERYGDLEGDRLRTAWLEGAKRTADAFGTADPDRRLPWVGPPMSAASSIGARLMETWAHGQALYDDLGTERRDTDRIEEIATLGVRTFGWTYTVRGEPKPDVKPYVELKAPSGAVWRYNDERSDERIEGPATAFCQVVTQTRNIADVPLEVTGPVATDWMSKAQCFAGGAEAPPAPGQRRKRDTSL
jgi:uncharacterized protein (TIGR03084 family)